MDGQEKVDVDSDYTDDVVRETNLVIKENAIALIGFNLLQIFDKVFANPELGKGVLAADIFNIVQDAIISLFGEPAANVMDEERQEKDDCNEEHVKEDCEDEGHSRHEYCAAFLKLLKIWLYHFGKNIEIGGLYFETETVLEAFINSVAAFPKNKPMAITAFAGELAASKNQTIMIGDTNIGFKLADIITLVKNLITDVLPSGLTKLWTALVANKLFDLHALNKGISRSELNEDDAAAYDNSRDAFTKQYVAASDFALTIPEITTTHSPKPGGRRRDKHIADSEISGESLGNEAVNLAQTPGFDVAS